MSKPKSVQSKKPQSKKLDAKRIREDNLNDVVGGGRALVNRRRNEPG